MIMSKEMIIIWIVLMLELSDAKCDSTKMTAYLTHGSKLIDSTDWIVTLNIYHDSVTIVVFILSYLNWIDVMHAILLTKK